LFVDTKRHRVRSVSSNDGPEKNHFFWQAIAPARQTVRVSLKLEKAIPEAILQYSVATNSM
jgi:hypothetical protein